MKISFFVPGTPQPGGSKKAFVVPGTNRASVVEDAKRNKPWRASVALAASKAYRGELLTGPLFVSFAFQVSRPRGHFGTGKNSGKLRQSAPRHPAKKPDVLKLARSTEDALTGVIWKDDAQTVALSLSKMYTDRAEGVWIRVWTMGEEA